MIILTNVFKLVITYYYFVDEVETQVALSTIGCNDNETPFISCLEMLEIAEKNNVWYTDRLKRFATPFGIEYAATLNPGTSICAIVREPFALIYDSSGNVATKVLQKPVNGEGR